MGSIPAWAGQPSKGWHSHRPGTVYPRVGGATLKGLAFTPTRYGLSPRGRGNRTAEQEPESGGGSIPAWAGQPYSGTGAGIGGWVYPRVGGATSTTCSIHQSMKGLSPRGRGNPGSVRRQPRAAWSIPAWAGQPGLSTPPTQSRMVYPRVGGATPSRTLSSNAIRGLSPRGRGNPERTPDGNALARSIPAWAGQPAD